jgi:hypothetical protein
MWLNCIIDSLRDESITEVVGIKRLGNFSTLIISYIIFVFIQFNARRYKLTAIVGTSAMN